MSADRTPHGASITMRGLTKRYGPVTAVDAIDLDARPGEFLTLLGPSGSGKTTTLNMIAGFVDVTEGELLIDDREMTNLPPYKRNIGMVFQHYALFPHMSVAENVEYPLRQRSIPKQERRTMVAKALETVGLGNLGRRRPKELSGGQQQRVALARAMVYSPRVLLMDEPLGALDKKLRDSLQLEIKRIHAELGTTFVYVTHDQDEAWCFPTGSRCSTTEASSKSARPQSFTSSRTVSSSPSSSASLLSSTESSTAKGKSTSTVTASQPAGVNSPAAPPWRSSSGPSGFASSPTVPGPMR